MSADQSPGLPDLPSGGEFDIRIARDGTWFHEGAEIARKPLVKLFATVLRRDDEGAYWLQTPVEKGRITVEDVPFVAVELSVRGSGEDQRLSFRTNLDEWVAAGAAHPLRVAESRASAGPSPYILVRDALEARILRPVYYELAELAVPAPETADGLGVWSDGVFFVIGNAA
ncbi:DUF1285 domain-containing protein [Pelagibius litoralis]|uniref:DUF1285 domain-containing protein n=1 Tax=Pelagibius litoralis TaxID=374515 RepID=A0A967F219_9PROT|nr:DUF1285 domain-containing protein [Pelagibius litoralis]NIA71645.1 DUF1285 domain-containing protein [Pelagibius litoralis]